LFVHFFFHEKVQNQKQKNKRKFFIKQKNKEFLRIIFMRFFFDAFFGAFFFALHLIVFCAFFFAKKKA
jgi:hypothetical protein